MFILFTTSKYPTSWLIRKITGEDCSHCAIQIGKQVIHCNFLGVQKEKYEDFIKKNQVKHSMFYAGTMVENLTADGFFDRYKSAKYDFFALIYLGLRYLLPFMPKVNLWQTTGMFMCTEFITEVLEGKENSLLTPHQLYIRLKNNPIIRPSRR
jgi:hypothetical protein